MEKESLINSLKEKIGENDFNAISRRSVETIIEPLLPMFADDDKVTDETYAIPVALLKSFIGQSRHDIAEGIKAEKTRYEAEKEKAVNDAVAALRAEYEKKNKPATEPKPAEKTEPASDDINSIIAAKIQEAFSGLTGKDGALGKLTDSFNTFIDSYNKEREMENTNDLKKRLTGALEELGADQSAVVELAIEKLNFKDKDYETLFIEAKSNYEELYKRLYANGPQPFAGGSSQESSDSGFKAYIARQQELANRQAEDAKALRGKMM